MTNPMGFLMDRAWMYDAGGWYRVFAKTELRYSLHEAIQWELDHSWPD